MKKSHLILGLVVVLGLAGLVYWGRDRMHFDFGVFRAQLAMANWGKIGIAVGCIYLGYIFRSVRWALLVRHSKKVQPFALLGTQVMGFTAVALIGRVADPVRPYLVARKTGLPLAGQVAVYIVERMFDLGSMALIFSTVILFAPAGSLPHAEIVKKAGYWGLGATLAGAVFLLAVRVAGEGVAAFLQRAMGLVSNKLGLAIGQKVRTFRAGLDTMRSLADFTAVAALSIGMWFIIAMAYLETMQAFVSSPELAHMNLTRSMLMLAASGGASVLQLPIIGWFSQIAVVAAALHGFYGATAEASTACAATMLLVTFLSIIPVGLIWAQFEHVSLRKVTEESEHAGQALAPDRPAESDI